MDRMKTDRNFWSFWFLSLITFGIYELWYMHHIVTDVNTMCEGDGKKSPGVLVFFLLSIVTCGVYGMIWWCNMHERMRAAATRYGSNIEQTTSGIMLLFIGAYFVMGILNWVAVYKFLDSMNQLSAAYNEHNGYSPYYT